MKRKEKDRVNLVCWNMRTLVEDNGRVRQSERKGRGSAEKKVVHMIWELKRYATFAAFATCACFGNVVYQIEKYTILHSGRQLPKEGEPLARGEAIDTALSPEGTKAWKNGGEQWELVSLRAVTTKLTMKV